MKLQSLQDHNTERKSNDKKMALEKLAYEIINKKLNIKFESVDKSDTLQLNVNHAIGVIDVNGFEIFSGSADIMGVFSQAAMMEHSCLPNTKHKFTSSHHIVIKAAVDIAEGDHISTTYTKILQGTAARRSNLLENKYFLCGCRRCADPTELGTFFSALRCYKCPRGYALPRNSLAQNSDWVCNECNECISSTEAKNRTSEIGNMVEEAMLNPDQESLEKLLNDTLAQKAHYNHYFLVRARHTLMQLYGRGPSALKDDILKKKEKLCQELLETLSILDPGDARVAPYTGVALFEYQDVVMVRAQKLSNVEYPDEKKIEQCIALAKVLLQKCIKVLRDEPEDLPEGILRVIAQKKLTEISLLTSKNIK